MSEFFQFSLETFYFRIADILPEVLVSMDIDVIDVEREVHAAFTNHQGGMRTQRVAHAKFVSRIKIERGDICHHQVGVQQLVIHNLFDQCIGAQFVSTEAFQASLFNCFFDNGIGGIQVKLLSLFIILFFAKSLDHKATFGHDKSPHK